MAKNYPKRPKNYPKWPKGKRASSSIMECEEFILPDWSPVDDPARPKAGYGPVMIMMMMIFVSP